MKMDYRADDECVHVWFIHADIIDTFDDAARETVWF